MSVPIQKITGQLLADDNQGLIIFGDGQELYLKFALVEVREGAHFFPDAILDDWGKEISGLHLYNWIRTNGGHFPRAEVFGCYRNDRPQQRFIRELEIAEPFPCYAFTSPTRNMSAGKLVRAIILVDLDIGVPKQLSIPADAPGLLSLGAIQWWAANTSDEKGIKELLEKYGIES